MRRFFGGSLKDARPGERLTLPEREAHHLARVTRLAVGETCELVDGEGRRVRARVEVIRRGEVVLRQQGLPEVIEAPCTRITVAQAVLRKQVFDTVVAKAQELGVERVIPVWTARTEVRPASERFGRMLERFGRIAREAAKQSGNARLVKIEEPVPLAEVLDRARDFGRAFVLSPAAERQLADALADPESRGEPGEGVLALIGPEGGLSSDEEAQALAKGFEAVRLTEHVLRADTAFVVTVGLIRSLAP